MVACVSETVSGEVSQRSDPLISVIVPTHARPEKIAECVTGLIRQDYPNRQFEVLVVDDGSPVPLAGLADRFRGQIDLTVLRQKRAGPARARNAGAISARGRYLAFIDDDCTPEPGWLAALAAQFAATPDDMLGGATVNAISDSVYAEASQDLLDYLYRYFDAHPDGERFFASCNLAAPAEPLRRMGGFDGRFPLAAAEDRDLCLRWLGEGRSLTYVESAVVRHSHEMSLPGFCRQHFSYGRGARYYHEAKRERGGPPLRVMPADFYTGMLAHPLRSGVRPKALVVAALTAVSQVANASGFVWETVFGRQARRRFSGDGEVPPLPHRPHAGGPVASPDRAAESGDP